ncbi:MAG: hypothetical protein CVU38_00325 [Chloroflexi bacterium HGW-Chloroflexi-1]|nr:MAG: hypothetical protein CVU38_00325 [Chloroflexi bacterium HGW-Chloroflexi-1]
MSLTPVPASSFRVALIYPTIKEATGGCSPPYALLGLATVLRDAGIGVRLFDIDAFKGDRAALVHAVVAYDPSLLGLPVFYNTYDDTAATLRELRKAEVSCPIVLGGPEVTADPETVHADFPDVPYVLAGESEWTLRTLAERLRAQQDTDDIPGLGFQKGASWVMNCVAPFTGLDQVPYPDRGLLGEAYTQGTYWRLGQRGTTDIIVSSRGCPFACRFCFKVTRKTSLRPSASIHAEIEHIRSLGTRNIMFQDDLFVSSLKRVKAVLDPIDPGWGIHFKVRARVDTINDDICAYLVSKGVTGVAVGFESGSDRMLSLMGKKTTVATNYRAMEIMQRHGLKVFADIFFMYPGEDMETAKETIDFIFRSKPTYVNWGMFIPLPGTPITQELQAKGLIKGRFGVGQRPRVIYDYLTDSQRVELNQYITSNMRRYNASLRHVVLPNLVDIVTTAGPRQYHILRDLYWKRYRPQWLSTLRRKSLCS